MKKWNKQFLAVLDKGDDDISDIQAFKKFTKWNQQYNMIKISAFVGGRVNTKLCVTETWFWTWSWQSVCNINLFAHLWSRALNDDTKNLTETDTETFFTIPNFLKPKPRLFSETETDTFLPRPNFPKPKPRLFFRDQIFWKRNWNPQKFGKSLETET